MPFTPFTKDDFISMRWDQYQYQVEKIFSDLMQLNIKFDFIVPIMRGGTPLAISLAHRLNVLRIMPVQYMYGAKIINGEREKTFCQLFTSIPSIKEREKEYTILVTEANHCTGKTAQSCINHIMEILPKSKIYYATIGRAYSHKGKLDNTEFETWGFLTNEDGELTVEECDKLHIINKFTLYPWETLEGELRDMNGE